jgi:hypothetical protein
VAATFRPAPPLWLPARPRFLPTAPPAGGGGQVGAPLQENDGNVGSTRQTQVTVTLPGNLAAGSVITVELTSNNAPTFTPPADGTWASVVRAANSTVAVVEAFRHVVQAGEVGSPGSWVFSVGATARSICWHATEWPGVDTGVPIDGTPTTVLNAATTAVNLPSVTVGDGAAVVVAACYSSGAGAFTTFVEPAGFTELADQHTTTTQTESSEHVSWESFPVGGATGTLTITAGSTTASGIAYALKAAPAGGGGTVQLQPAALTTAAQPLFPPVLPGSIDVIEPEAVAFHGPFADANGNLYRVGETILSDDNNPRVGKSTDGGRTWTYPDDVNRPTQSDFEAGCTVQTAGFLHVFFFTGAQFEYHRFNTSDNATTPDTWTVKRQAVATPAEVVPQYGWGVLLASGDAVAFYDVSASGSRLKYRRRVSGTWGAETAVDDTITITQHVAVVGTGDVTHLVYKDDTNNQLKLRTLTSGGTLSGATRIDTSGVADTLHAPVACPPVRYTDGGSEVIAVAFAVGTGLRVVRVTNGTPGAEETITGATPAANPGTSTNEGVVCSLAADGTTLHAVWSDSATLDVWHSQSVAGGAWTTPDELRDGTNALWVGANVFTHAAGNGGKRVLGYTYFDNTDPNVYPTRYHELELAVAQTVQLTAATMTTAAQPVTAQPGAVTRQLTPAAATVAAQPVTVQPGVVSVQLTPAAATVAAQPLGVVPGARTVQLTPAAATVAAQPLGIVPGPAQLALTSVAMALAAQPLTVSQGLTIALGPAAATLTAQPLTVQPGAASRQLTTAPATVAAQPLGIQLGTQTVQLTATAAVTAAQPVTVQPGVVSVQLTPAAGTLAAQPLTVTQGLTVALTAAAATLTARILTVQPGPVTVQLTPAAATITASVLTVQPGAVTRQLTPAAAVTAAQPVSPTIAVTVALQPASVAATARPLSVTVGARAVELAAAAVVATAQPAGVVGGPAVRQLSAAAVTTAAQPLGIIAGLIPDWPLHTRLRTVTPPSGHTTFTRARPSGVRPTGPTRG